MLKDSAIDVDVEGCICSMMGSVVSVSGAISNAGRAGTLTMLSLDAMVVCYLNLIWSRVILYTYIEVVMVDALHRCRLVGLH